MKFCAVHSSAALAVNCFAPFKDRPEDLLLLGKHDAAGIQFEKQMPIIPWRHPSNLDVWIDRGSNMVAIESKLLEYFNLNKAHLDLLVVTQHRDRVAVGYRHHLAGEISPRGAAEQRQKEEKAWVHGADVYQGAVKG